MILLVCRVNLFACCTSAEQQNVKCSAVLCTHDCSTAACFACSKSAFPPLFVHSTFRRSPAHPSSNWPWRACSAPSPPTPWTRWRWAVPSLAPITLIPSMMSGSPSVTPSPCSCQRMARYWSPKHGFGAGRHRTNTQKEPNNKSTYRQDCWTPFNSTSRLFRWANRAEITPVTWPTLWWSRRLLRAPQTVTAAHRWANTPL